jgi:protein-S-isoprenylcysteine O-methyltransferase Ste14
MGDPVGNGAIYLAGIIFGLMALLHLARIFCPFQVQIGDFIVPLWASYAGFIIFGLISVFLFRARHFVNKTKLPPTP